MSLLDTLLEFDAALEWYDDDDDPLLGDPSGGGLGACPGGGWSGDDHPTR